MITQGTRLLVARRSLTAPRRPGQFCEAGGVFEVVDPDKDHIGNDFIASLLKESLEIAIKKGARIYVPQLSAISKNLTPDKPELRVYFQPPDISLSSYNQVITQELKKECRKARVPGHDSGEMAYFHMKILEYDRSVKLQYGYSPEISVEITSEVDTSSLECVGVLSFPACIDLAALAFLEDLRRIKDGKLTADEDKLLSQLNAEVAEARDRANDDTFQPRHELWDTECMKDELELIQGEIRQRQPTATITEGDMTAYEEEGGQWFFPLDREIHMIDFMKRTDHICKTDGKFAAWNRPTDRTRYWEKSSLGAELSKVKLRATGGNFATEKLSLAIKMHCPLPQLEPLIAL